MKIKIKRVFTVFYLGFIFVLVVLGVLIVASVYKDGGLRVLVVQSGSMEPTIKTASVVLVLPKGKQEMISPVEMPNYQAGEVVTFEVGKEMFTHRIVGFERVGGKYVYLTKGDANQNIDLDKVNENNVVGRVVITVPYLGYLFDFFKTQLGYILLFVVPITIIVYGELLSIKKEFIRMIGERRKSSMIL